MDVGLNGAPPLPQDRYWAAVESEDLPSVILGKALRYRSRLQRDGRLDLFRRSERTYYGFDAEGGFKNSVAVTYGGENGEQVMIRVNHFRSIEQGILATAILKRIAYEPRATNTDAESARQVVLARSLLEFYTRACDLEGRRTDTARTSLNYGEGYTVVRWNPFVGKPYASKKRPVYDEAGAPVVDETGAPAVEDVIEREGDVEVQTMTPVEVIHDLDSTRPEMDWCLLPYRENVWNLAARYPEHREQILKLRGSSSQRWPRSAWSMSPFERTSGPDSDDEVTVWWMYHVPTDALPTGRHAIVVGEVVVYDGPMDLAEVPVYRLTPEREMTLSRGHSPMWDLLALQEVYDAILNSQISVVDAFGQMNVLVPKGSDISSSLIARGLQMLEFTPNPDAGSSGGRPEALELFAMPAGISDLREVMKNLMETISGINSVIRGDPMPQLKSGAALALVQSLALAFNSGFQAEVVRHCEHVATGILALLKRYAENKRNVEIVGRANKGAMLSWSKDDLSSVERVTIEVGSPLQESTAGRLEIAQQLLSQPGLIKNPEQLIEVINTGRLEPLYSGERAELDLIARENEDLADAVPCEVVVTDDHQLHVLEHKAVLAMRAVRSNPALRESVLQHINEHTQKWLAMGPELGLLTKQTAQPPPPPALQAGAPPQGSPPKPAGISPLGGSQPVDPGRARPLGGPPPPGGPMMPVNPLTGQRAPQP